MDAKQNETQVQELKSSWVQQELMAEEPFRLQLKSSWVQEEIAVPEVKVRRAVTPVYELACSQPIGVTIELPDLNALIHVIPAGGNEAA
jgi:hypothetical protein